MSTLKRSTTSEKNKREDMSEMDDFQREFLELRNKTIKDDEVRVAINSSIPSGKYRMDFGCEPLPWEKQLTMQETKHLQDAKEKTYKCKNKQCTMYEKSAGKLFVVMHQKEVPHSKTGGNVLDKLMNNLYVRRFGIKRNTCFHIEVVCAFCKQHIQYVKYSDSNRRIAQDPRISGPHQKQSERK